MTSQQNLNKAIEIVKQATEKDEAKQYEEAYSLYQKALDYFMLYLKHDKNEKLKAMVRRKVDEYLKRAEELRKTIEQPKKVKTPQEAAESLAVVTATTRRTRRRRSVRVLSVTLSFVRSPM